MICIYHSKDLDGYSSAAIARKAHPNITLIGYDYADEYYPTLPLGERVIMIDVSMPMEKMHEISVNSGYQFTWIDHHASAIRQYKQFVNENPDKEPFCEAVLQEGSAACEIAWDYFFPQQTMPEAISLLGHYDVWRRQDEKYWEEFVVPFQYGMKARCTHPDQFDETLLDASAKSMINYVVQDGTAIVGFQKAQNLVGCTKDSFVAEFEGFCALCWNTATFGSMPFEGVFDETKHDIMLPFQYASGKWHVGLYSTKDGIDCSVLAKKYGGGGHRGAAGFSTINVFNIIKQK